jgi:hypothetical protein
MVHRMPSLIPPLAGVVLLVAAACGGDPEPSAEQTSTTTAPAPSTTTTSPPSAPTYRLVSVQGGDAACYLGVTDAAGAEQTFPADFELCPGGTSDASRHIGTRVTLERRPGQIMADSCAGDPNCTDTKTVDLVIEVKPAAAP